MTNFKFKKFSVSDDSSAMKIGTDAVLLGAWTDVSNSNTILDIGSGSGIIAMMLAQRTKAKIEGVEINEKSYLQAEKNVGNSNWQNRIKFFHKSFQEFYKNTKTKYDLIVSNPPYFSNSLKTPNQSRTIARHNDLLSYEEIIIGVKKILKQDGKFYLILPATESKIFIDRALIESLYCSEMLLVKDKKEKPIKRILMKFELLRHSQTKKDELIIRNNDGSFTQEYKNLTSDFYLQF